MIQSSITHHCPRCGSAKLVKNGHDYKGAQKYTCKNCGRYGTVLVQRGYGDQRRIQVQRTVLERLLGISRRTVAAWVEAWAQMLPPLEETLAEARLEDVLELDEVWSFVLKKDQQRRIWVALCRRTRQIVAYFIGDRTETSYLQLCVAFR
jgi:transposase-like protein